VLALSISRIAAQGYLLELEGAELLVNDLPDDLVGRHVEAVGRLWSFGTRW